MKDPASPQFLDRRSYRRKRLIDAARLLPLMAAVLLLMPLPLEFAPTPAQGGAVALGLYLFILWLVLILAAALMSRPLARALDERPSAD